MAENPAVRNESSADQPTVLKNPSFWGLTVAQFLGAFNDNLFKQVVLLLFVAIPVAGGGTRDMQWLATIVFSLPFVMFSGLAGYFSDRGSKSRLIFFCKAFEILIAIFGVTTFLIYAQLGIGWIVISCLCVVLFGFGVQSAFFGPSKYGILPEILEDRDLPAANGIIVMLTFVSIILGMASAGLLKDAFGDKLWGPGLVCVGIAVAGCIATKWIRNTPPADPDLQFDKSTLTIANEIRALLKIDRPLCGALFISCTFWMTAAIVQQAVNGFGKHQLALEKDSLISYLVATISLGIAIGAAICGYISKGQLKWSMLRLGAAGITGCLMLMSITIKGQHMLGYWGSLAVLTLLGVFTGMFAIPLQVFLQARPPEELKGRMIATQNFLNWIAIIASGLIYLIFTMVVNAMGWQNCFVFLLTACIMLPIAIFYRPTATINLD